MKLRVIWPGKTKKAYYKQAIEDYAGRISKLIPFEIVETREEARSDKQKAVRIRKESEILSSRKRAPLSVVLDPQGNQLTSEEFAKWLAKITTDVDFILGGPQGYQDPDHCFLMTFSRMTLPHELARVVLLEQIYRALTILKRIPYHK